MKKINVFLICKYLDYFINSRDEASNVKASRSCLLLLIFQLHEICK